MQTTDFLFILNSQVLRNQMKSRKVPYYRWQLSIWLILVRLPLRETFLNKVPFALAIKPAILLIWMSPGNSTGRKFPLQIESGFLFTQDPLYKLCNMSFCLMTEPSQCFWTTLQELANVMLQIHCQGRERWAAPRAEISQARAVLLNRGNSLIGSNRARLGEGQLPRGPDKARSRVLSREASQKHQKAGRETGLECRLGHKLNLLPRDRTRSETGGKLPITQLQGPSRKKSQ